MKSYEIILSVLVSGLLVSSVCAMDHTISGSAYFTHYPVTLLKPPASGSNLALPERSQIELRKSELIGSSSVAFKTVGSNGSYTFTVADPGDNDYFLVFWLRTMKNAAANATPRVQIGDIGLHHYRSDSHNYFRFTNEDPTTHTITLDIICGDTGDTDDPVSATTHKGTLKQWDVVNPLFVSYDEKDIARLTAFMLVLDTAYGEVETSGKIAWFGQMYSWDTEGMRVFTPGGAIGAMGGATSWPENTVLPIAGSGMVLYLGSSDKDWFWKADTAAHEFGHMIHYHTTDWSIGDLANEAVNPHGLIKETDTKVAVAEGWAEFVEAAFVRSHASLIDQGTTGRSWPAITLAPGWGLYRHAWKGSECDSYPSLDPRNGNPLYSDGTNNSGEIVEGAVGQIFWSACNPAGTSFVTDIEPAWRVLREGATSKDARNHRKKMHTSTPENSVYDTWMKLASGATNASARQTFRDNCAQHGIVYSRMKVTKYRPVLGVGDWQNIADKVWISAKGEFQLATLLHSDLNTAEDGPSVSDAKLRYLKSGTNHPRQNPYDLSALSPQQVLDSDIATIANWLEFGTANASGSFVGGLDAASSNLSNKYYLIRGEVEKDKIGTTADTDTRDNFTGPLLGDALGTPVAAPDKSGKLTAQQLNSPAIVVQIKIDKVPVKAPTPQRFPPAN